MSRSNAFISAMFSWRFARTGESGACRFDDSPQDLAWLLIQRAVGADLVPLGPKARRTADANAQQILARCLS